MRWIFSSTDFGYIRYAICYKTSRPGSTCKIVLTLSKKTLALFSSPLATLTLKTFAAAPGPKPAITPVGRVLRPFALDVAGLAMSISIISGLLDGPGRVLNGVDGRAVICGVKLPRDVFGLILSRPRT